MCGIDEECCDDGTCGLCCWILQEHPEGTGDCACSEETDHCGEYIEAWSISTCERSSSGYESCGITFRQVGPRYACDESTDWINLFLCWGGSASECVGICSAGSAACIASGFNPDSCLTFLLPCQECVLNFGDGPDCGCVVVHCEIGDVIEELWENAGTLSGEICQ